MSSATKVLGSVVAGTNCENILQKYYGITPKAMHRQRGFDDITYIVEATDGKKYVFKVLAEKDSKDIGSNHEVNVMEFIRKKGVNVPQTYPTKDGVLIGEEYFEDEVRGRHLKAFKLIEFIEGRTMWMPGEPDQFSPELAYEMGLVVGKTDAALDLVDFIDLEEFAKTPTFNTTVNADLPDVIAGMSEISAMTEQQRQWCRDWKKDLYEPLVLAKDPELHKQLIHADIHVGNFIFSEGGKPIKIHAIIDFGNLMYYYRLADVAMGLLSFVMFAQSPVECIKAYLRGYCQNVKLSLAEKKAIFPFLLSRAVHIQLIHMWRTEHVPSYVEEYVGKALDNRLWPVIERLIARHSPEEEYLNTFAEQ